MKNISYYIWLSILNFVGFIGVIIVNTLANILPINGKNTGELSDLYPNLFVPAGLTFSIWGVIYILLLIFVIYGLVLALKKDPSGVPFIERIGPWFFISSIANISWIFAWHYEQVGIALILMLLLLISLIMIYQRLNIGRSVASNKEKYLVHLPFSIYFGWISIATIANVTALLVDTNWGGFGVSEATWASIMILTGVLLAIILLFNRNDIFYPFVTLWAILGIILKRTAADADPSGSIVIVCIIGMALIAVSITVQAIRGKVYKA